MMRSAPRAKLTAALSFALIAMLARSASAHLGDTSYTEIDVASRSVTTSVTMQLDMLRRLLQDDEVVDLRELEASSSEIQSYLASHLLLSLDDGPPSLGVAAPPEWPSEEETDADGLRAQATFRFVRPVETPPKLVSLVYDVWVELGPAHANVTRLRQEDGKPLDVVFTEAEPDFDYFVELEPTWFARTVQRIGSGVESFFLALESLLATRAG